MALDFLSEKVNGSQRLINFMKNEYILKYPGFLMSIKKSINDKNLETLSFQAHAFKNMLIYFREHESKCIILVASIQNTPKITKQTIKMYRKLVAESRKIFEELN